MRGTLTSMMRDRGFGFVRSDDGREIFIHHSVLAPGVFDTLLHENHTRLEFDLMVDPKGRGERATNVRILG